MSGTMMPIICQILVVTQFNFKKSFIVLFTMFYGLHSRDAVTIFAAVAKRSVCRSMEGHTSLSTTLVKTNINAKFYEFVFDADVYPRALIAGGGAPEIELSIQLMQYAQTLAGVEQYCVRAFADALEIIPFTLAENAGLNPIATVTELRNRHSQGEKTAGINVRKVRSPIQEAFKHISIFYITISVLQTYCAVITEYGIPSDFVRKSTASLKIKISTAQLSFSNRNVIIFWK